MVPFAGSLGKLGNYGDTLSSREGFLMGACYQMDSLEEFFSFINFVLAGLGRK